VTPSSGLVSGETVKVHATGFKPGSSLVVIECALKGEATGAGDCNLDGLVLATADAKGDVDTQLKVLRGPFGTNKVTCSATQACIVSVNPPTPSPTEQASAAIHFR
jgi:hypothetical protein